MSTPQKGLRWFLWRDVIGGGLDKLSESRAGDALRHLLDLPPKERESSGGTLGEASEPAGAPTDEPRS